MKNRPLRAGGRSVPLLVLGIIVAGIGGSVLSHFVSRLFPEGPVRNFFFGFAHVGTGSPGLTLDLEFVRVAFELQFSISAFAVLLVAVVVYLWYRL